MSKFKKLNYLEEKNDKTFLAYIAPITFIVLLFWVIPIFISIGLSFTEYNALATPKFVGFKNYQNLFKNKIFLKSLINTIVLTITIVPGQTILSFLMAAWLYKTKSCVATKFVRWVMLVPTLISLSVIGVVVRLLLNDSSSPINKMFLNLGIKDVLGTSKGAMTVIIVVSILIRAGYYAVIFYSNMMDIPKTYLELADLDGINQFKIYKNILVPLMKPSILLIIFLGIIETMQKFDVIYTLTGGGPGNTGSMVPMIYLYLHGFKYGKIGFSMAIGNVMILLVGCISILQRKNISIKESSLF